MGNFHNDKAQVAIWIIVALVVVASVLVVAFLNNRSPTADTPEETSPQSFIQACADKSVNEALDIMLPQGGFIEPTNTIHYFGTNITYHCENKGNYKPCINQHPMLLNEMSDEIHSYVEPRIEECFQQIKEQAEKRNSQVSLGPMDLEVQLYPKNVKLKIERELTISSGETARAFTEFDIEVFNPAYDIARVASEISSQEAKYCNFEYVGYMMIHSWVKVEKTSLSEGTKLYKITDKKSNKFMNIAVRGCAIPAGL